MCLKGSGLGVWLWKSQKENGSMKTVLIIIALVTGQAVATQWSNYAEFEADATNAIANIDILMSDSYTNRLHLCRAELAPTNEISSAALLMMALVDDAKSNRVVEFIGSTNCLSRVTWFLDSPVQERTLWQKICAITILATGNKDSAVAAGHFNIAVNTLQQWDSLGNCFSGGELYSAIARYFGAPELSPRTCLIFAIAVLAKKAGMAYQFDSYSNLLPTETREFLIMDNLR